MKGGSSLNFVKVRMMSGFDENELYEYVFTDVSNPCRSAPSAFYRNDSRTKSTEGEVSGFIYVHQRFFYDVTLQTGSTGWIGFDFLGRWKDEFF